MNEVARMIRIKIGERECQGRLTDEEKAILGLIPSGNGRRITCRQIASSEPFLGCHPEWELPVGYPPTPSTMRKVFQIIHDLRGKGIAILGDRGDLQEHQAGTTEGAERITDRLQDIKGVDRGGVCRRINVETTAHQGGR